MHIGILGGGQLAKMMIEAGRKLGYDFTFLDPSSDPSSSYISPQIKASYDDKIALQQLAKISEIITYEFENVPASCLKYFNDEQVNCYIAPNIKALNTCQDRLKEKQLFEKLLIPTNKFTAIFNDDKLYKLPKNFELPAILKTRTQGYDGKGQYFIKKIEHINEILLSQKNNKFILEQYINFIKEISIIAVRDKQGKILYYPISENKHVNGILAYSICYTKEHPLQLQAQKYMKLIMDEFDYVGVMCLELFVTEGNKLIANEIAPRVHNSGHWSIEGAVTSQFENHIRAITGMPLGNTDLVKPVAMVNLIGNMPPDTSKLMAIKPDIFIHDYNKKEREGRKLGHITIKAETHQQLMQYINDIQTCSGSINGACH